GTFTNAQGEFTIEVPKGGKITVSIVGYDTKTIPVTTNYINITLAQNSNQIEEVVVTSLGVKKETKKLGYSVQEVKGADLVKAREVNPV
ncbi:carboxypeptidase-like regulatory domain-containing protein, partial [Pseudomonas aeruginosa]|uniref:carboxypeptidase-like regulatory domain-containing protein n=1 Tax=Pseudomonas aeruginosa TaxID=287 RepID=UPI002B401652